MPPTRSFAPQRVRFSVLFIFLRLWKPDLLVLRLLPLAVGSRIYHHYFPSWKAALDFIDCFILINTHEASSSCPLKYRPTVLGSSSLMYWPTVLGSSSFM